MKASRQQVPGKKGGLMAVGVLHVGGQTDASVAKNLLWLSWTAGQAERDGGSRPEASRLASFAGANRTRLAMLMEAKVTAGLREGVTGVTYLASVRPSSSRLTAAPIVLARSSEVASLRTSRNEDWDEGGIYSW
jgi:hypothetical protein